MMKRLPILLFMFFMLSLTGMAQVPFTPGNIVVQRLGDGSVALTSGVTSAWPVFLDEYTPAGILVQSIAMPTAVNGSNQRLTDWAAGGSAGGWLTLSANGQYLVLAGYNAAVGTAGVHTSSAATIPRVIGLVKYDASINTSTALTDFADGNFVRGATSTNGIDLWGVGSVGGIRYTIVGSTTSTQIAASPAGYNTISIVDGQLYVSTQVDPNIRVATVGTGLPTTSPQTVTNLPGIPLTAPGGGAFQPFQFAFADLNPGVPGVDVLYVADQTSNNIGIGKYSLVGGTWVSNGYVSGSSSDFGNRGLTVSVSGTTVTLYATRTGTNNTTVGGGELVTLVDATGYNGAFSGTPTVISNILTRFGANSFAAYRGIALVPQAPSVKVSIKTFLQGAYSSGLGRHKDVTVPWAAVLNASALSQPYNTAAFGNYAGTESVAANFFTSTGANTDILDWVLLELRDATTPTTVVARRAAFIREDGRVVDLDGTSDVSFSGVGNGNYYVVVRHRNHLGIRSFSTIALSSTATLYDFSAQLSNAYDDGSITSNEAMQDVSGNGTVFAMWGGNANSNTRVSFTGVNNDAGTILGALGSNQGFVLSSVYNSADVNMDGSVKYTGTNNDSGLLLSVLGSNQAAVYNQHL